MYTTGKSKSSGAETVSVAGQSENLNLGEVSNAIGEVSSKTTPGLKKKKGAKSKNFSESTPNRRRVKGKHVASDSEESIPRTKSKHYGTEEEISYDDPRLGVIPHTGSELFKGFTVVLSDVGRSPDDEEDEHTPPMHKVHF